LPASAWQLAAQQNQLLAASELAREGMNMPAPTPASMTPDNEQWTLVIRPRRPWRDLRLQEIWHARDLIMLFVRRDFVAQHKQTVLGPFWVVAQPLLTTVVFTLVFGRIARLSTDGLPPFLFYMAGTVAWSYFAACLTKTADTFATNAHIFGKVYFPRLTVPISILISNLATFFVHFALFLGFVGYFWLNGAAVRISLVSILLLPVALFIMAGLGLGAGIIVSSLTTRYRDLQNVVTFGTQLLMYATPVIYPLSATPVKYRFLVEANPMTSVVEAFRGAFLGTDTIAAGGLLYSFGFMVVALILGVLFFNRVEQTFMDTV
jgi:lipopolysaccharide transport system permease protein